MGKFDSSKVPTFLKKLIQITTASSDNLCHRVHPSLLFYWCIGQFKCLPCILIHSTPIPTTSGPPARSRAPGRRRRTRAPAAAARRARSARAPRCPARTPAARATAWRRQAARAQALEVFGGVVLRAVDDAQILSAAALHRRLHRPCPAAATKSSGLTTMPSPPRPVSCSHQAMPSGASRFGRSGRPAMGRANSEVARRPARKVDASVSMCQRWSLSTWTAPSLARRWNGASFRSASDALASSSADTRRVLVDAASRAGCVALEQRGSTSSPRRIALASSIATRSPSAAGPRPRPPHTARAAAPAPSPTRASARSRGRASRSRTRPEVRACRQRVTHALEERALQRASSKKRRPVRV